jgi:carboxylate-amine ligase
VIENKWRAQRYGIDGTFVDRVSGGISVAGMLDQTIAEIERDARTLGCLAEIEHCRAIAGAGTSADAQIEVFKRSNGNDDNRRAALRAVSDWIAVATLR